MDPILIADDGPIRTITLNRPEQRNALTPAMQQQLIDALEAAANARSVRLVVLTGAGKAFCAGLDIATLQTMAAATETSPEALAEDGLRFARILRTLYELPLPTIAAVNGHAIAGGTGIATVCDFTLAVPAVKFGYTEAKIGFVPAVVSAYLGLQLGDKRARDLMLTGRLFTADEAHTLGLVTEVVAPEALAARVQELAASLIANSPASVRATKALLAEQNRAWLDQALAAAIASSIAARQTPDFREGITAFLEKRKPEWLL